MIEGHKPEIEIYTPIKPQERDPEHFDAGEEIVAFLDSGWSKGKIIDGFRHHDGCINVEFENGKTATYGLFRPEVMLTIDYKYFRKRPDSAKAWISSCKDLPSINPGMLLRTLLNDADLFSEA